MTQEDKELLLKDLCARLPYGVKVRRYVYTTPTDTIESVELLGLGWLEELYAEEAEFKPYLFPMSSMTDEQKEELSNEMCYLTHSQIEGRNPNGLIESTVFEIDFYNKHHIDYRGFIEKGLALDATGLNIY